MLLQKVQSFITQHSLAEASILVAVSGGVDSMVLLHALKKLGLSIEVAHCNFGLRNEDSDLDEKLVSDWCEKHEVKCHVQHFHTGKILHEEGGNLQQLAREQRYNWFAELCEQYGFRFVATAHHANDSIETALYNFFKGTGIAGLHGILPVNNNIIRPLLNCTRAEILAYAEQENIFWREDKSNATTKYKRNAIRHEVLPVIQEVFPQGEQGILQTIQHLSDVEILFKERMAYYQKKLLEKRGQDWYIPILKLKHVPSKYTILYELLLPFGFNSKQIEGVLQLLNSESGKYIESDTHKIIKNRNFLIITSVNTVLSDAVLLPLQTLNAKSKVTIEYGLSNQLQFKTIPQNAMASNYASASNLIYVDAQKLEEPVILRPWKQGDYLYPIGMNNKKKKVSKLLIDHKVPLHEKANIWVLESNKKIVWVLGLRMDERFKIVENTQQVMSIEMMQKP